MAEDRKLPKAEWRGRAQFAEVAETLGIRTDQVMGALMVDGRFTVAWSDHVEGGATVDTPVRVSLLERDDAGVLHVTKTKESGTFGEFIDALDPGAPD
jgi:hypothetical protein